MLRYLEHHFLVVPQSSEFASGEVIIDARPVLLEAPLAYLVIVLLGQLLLGLALGYLSQHL